MSLLTPSFSDSMIFIGIDDTDSLDSRGTNKLARAIATELSGDFTCHMIVRHQLLFDERIPFTSHNGSASICLEPRRQSLSIQDCDFLFEKVKSLMLSDFIVGSDPGLCIADSMVMKSASHLLIDWGKRCQSEIVTQSEAISLASNLKIRIEGLGGTNGGVIGALAAIGLTYSGNDGRLVSWSTWPDDISGPTPVTALRGRNIEVRSVEFTPTFSESRPNELLNVLDRKDGVELFDGIVDVGKHARPNLRDHRAVLFVTRCHSSDQSTAEWLALKLK